MKCCKRKLAWLSIVVIWHAAFVCGIVRDSYAGPFRNLDFELAVISPGLSDALPYWLNDSEAGLGYDTVSFGGVAVIIHDSLSPVIKPLQGNFSVVLQNGAGPDVYISQAGDVPSYARSLMFSTDMVSDIDRLQVSLGGTAVPFRLYSVGNTVNPSWGPVKTYISDVSAFAGEENLELRFQLASKYPLDWSDLGAIDLDAIAFSPIVVPEPSSLLLLTVSIISLAGYFRHRRNRNH